MSLVQDIVGRVWKLCDILRDDGITYHQYVNELTYLLFLKMAQETGTERLLLQGCRWGDLLCRREEPDEQYHHYLHMLNDLGTRGRGRVKQIFANPTTFLHHPESLNKLLDSIDSIDWHMVGREGLGDVYEGILQKNASEKKSGAGQYFTPRPLIETVVEVVKPQHGETIVDPAVGTAGFFISAQAYLTQNGGREGKFQDQARFFGVELVRESHRLALMNAMLHGIDGDIELGDSLAIDGVMLPQADLVLTNPPFGSKRGAGRPMRKDLPFPTSNKQLAFLQLIYQTLSPGGRAGVVLPDNVLFEEGVAARVREELMDKCNLHTILRLPTGIFYAEGVKTNVLFFTKSEPGKKNSTKGVWIYDLRTDAPAFGKRTPLTRGHFKDFVRAYGTDPSGKAKRRDEGEHGRFRYFSRESIWKERQNNLDISWLKHQKDEETIELPEPEEIAAAIAAKLKVAMEELEAVSALLDGAEVEVE
jgi:type I restriction enzyme M protein